MKTLRDSRHHRSRVRVLCAHGEWGFSVAHHEAHEQNRNKQVFCLKYSTYMVARRFDWRRTTHAPNSPTAAHAIIALPIRNASSSISKVGVRTLRAYLRRSGHRGSERRVPPYHCGSGDPARAQKSRATVIQPTAPLRSRSALVARIDEVRASGAFHAVREHLPYGCPVCWYPFPSSRTAANAIIALPIRNASSLISKVGVCRFRTGVPGRPVPSRKKHPGITCV